MRGLLRNNFYAAYANVKVFSVVMTIIGLFVLVMDNEIPSLIIGYMVSVMIGFSLNSVASVRNESVSKWSKHKLAAPVRRADIVKSLYLSQLIWLLAGAAFAGCAVVSYVLLHGNPFDKATDIFMVFVLGISVSLFMGAVFFPLFFLGGEERNEAFLIISLTSGIGMFMGLVTLVDIIFQGYMTPMQIIVSGIVILACGGLAFVLSYLFVRRRFQLTPN